MKILDLLVKIVLWNIICFFVVSAVLYIVGMIQITLPVSLVIGTTIGAILYQDSQKRIKKSLRTLRSLR
jgi:hypothetical protein